MHPLVIRSEQQAIAYIKREHKRGVTITYIADKFDISYTIVCNVVSGKTKSLKKWRNIVRYFNVN